jgi:phytoene dehydrogenase-like protein
MTRPVVIGAGHNGLIAAFYLAKAGYRPIVLERREQVGGAVVTSEIHPGFHVPTLAHAVGPLRPDVTADLGLVRRGVEVIAPAFTSFSPREDGRALLLARDPMHTARHLARFSSRDAATFPAFHRAVAQGASLLADLGREIPPSLDRPGASELWHLLKTGRRFRGLGRKDAYRLLRMAPMPVADLTEDWFDTDILRAAMATRGVLGTNLGPRSAGTVATLLLDAARDPDAPGAPSFVRGGMGRLTGALAAAAAEAGAEIRTGVDVVRIEVDDTGVRGVVLSSGEQIATGLVVSNADPKRTLLGLVDPVRLEPGFLLRVRNIRARGTLAKVNLALAGLPAFTAARDLPQDVRAAEALAGRILIAPGIDYLEQAFDVSKYGGMPVRPFLECVIPTLADATLAPEGRHVMSIYVQYAPFDLRGSDWNAARDSLQQTVLDTLAGHAPGLPSLVLAAQTITPADLEATYSLTGGHIHHGELALDQLYVMRPLLGWAQHRTPIAGLYLCGAGTHPGGGISGANGANAARVVIRDGAGR